MEVGAALRSVVMRQMAEAFYYSKAQTAFHGSLKVLWQKYESLRENVGVSRFLHA